MGRPLARSEPIHPKCSSRRRLIGGGQGFVLEWWRGTENSMVALTRAENAIAALGA
jgi:hypothetical protein